MSHGTDKHLEHAEHVQHQAHDPFDRRVAMTMTIMAAILAGVTLVSHRGHTETLRMANEATTLHTEGSTMHTQANDQWNFFQAKNIRSHEYQASLFMEMLLEPSGGKQDEKSKSLRDYWITQIEKYEGDDYWPNFLKLVDNYRERGNFKSSSEFLKYLKENGKDRMRGLKNSELAELQGKAMELDKKAKEFEKKAGDKEHESHDLHAKVTWVDLGHLGLELALVFCAVAVLTKQRSFWLTGICFGLVGTGLAGYGMIGWWLMGGGHH